MYRPEKFVVGDAEALRLIDQYPFATLIASTGKGPFVSHLPLLLETSGDAGPRIIGHMARKNPQWQLLAGSTPAHVLAIFHGPHTYVTPTWYKEHDVPTWNYAVVHVEGSVRLLETPKDLVRILTKLTDRFEGKGDGAWRFGLPDDLAAPGQLAAAIVGFEIKIEKLTPKFKLNQNRIAEDRDGVMRGLAERTDDESRGVLELMKRSFASGSG